MKEKDEKVRTKKPMKATTIFLTENDCRQWRAAASLAGISRSELMRLALREKAAAILMKTDSLPEQ